MSDLAWTIQPSSPQRALEEVLARESPSLERHLDGVRLRIYQAKAPHGSWASEALEKLVQYSRESYRTLYGPQVALFDEYDAKAWIYVAVSSYDYRGRSFSEALSLRFVPAAGAPLRTDDLNFYRHRLDRRASIIELLAERRGGLNAAQLMRGCYSQSRMGALRPCADDGCTLSGNHHVALAWCLMLECFLDDATSAGRPCRLLTSQTTENLRTLGARIPTRTWDDELGLDAGSIVLDRQKPHVRSVCYGVPTYFLNLKDVTTLLERLLRDGWLSETSVQAAVTPGTTLARALGHPHPGRLRRLNSLFAARGTIPGSRLTGEELRRLADVEVADGPVLRLTRLTQLQAELALLRDSERVRPESFIRTSDAYSETA
jgi:hypothetical protein